jgi:transglutaminase-like putative cysteine protease
MSDHLGQLPQEPAALPPADCLGPTRFIDCEHPSIQKKVRGLAVVDLAPAERAVRLFAFVRDRISYEFKAKLKEAEYIASNVLAAGMGFCVQKAVLLCALARAAEIPAALVLTNLRDHTLPEKLREGMRTDVLYYHGLAAFHLDGLWVKVDASLTAELVARKGYRLVEFDGHHDALLAPTTETGEPHSHYIAVHGMFADLPFAAMIGAFREGYRGGDPEILEMVGVLPSGTT